MTLLDLGPARLYYVISPHTVLHNMCILTQEGGNEIISCETYIISLVLSHSQQIN